MKFRYKKSKTVLETKYVPLHNRQFRFTLGMWRSKEIILLASIWKSLALSSILD